MEKKTIILITGSERKAAIAQNAINGTGYTVLPQKVDCLEIQDDDVVNIAKYSARYASNLLQKDVVKSDSGLFITALGGFPGPYGQYIERKLTSQDILSLMANKQNRSAVYRDALVYCKSKGTTTCFVAETKGTIALKKNGSYGGKFDKIFIRDGDTVTMANFTLEDMRQKYSNSHWQALIQHLEKLETKEV